MTTSNQIAVYTSDMNLNSEIIRVLSKHGSKGYSYKDSKTLLDSISEDTSIVIVDFESGLFQNQEFSSYIRIHYPNVKLVLLTLIENLVHCYQLLGGNIFEIVIKNQLTKSKINRIMATLSYYNQFAIEDQQENTL